ncbi:MAG: oxygen-independent coproporphyrinogen III oxidase-like protein [Xanthomonadales bacterium]|nr:oxygen-independent coproporphyrinogen III oxidase-like protein [Xanthomonadales bacterium]
MTPPPLSLYVHLPWCVRKCPYCDFNSHAAGVETPFEDYTRLLLRDLEFELPLVWGRPVQSVFFGGGTPSLFSAAQFERLISGIRSRLSLAPGAEITLEANPGAVEHDRFASYRDAGINRVSIGVQSFDDPCLARIGRIHGRAEVERALEAIGAAAFDSINIDLMYGLPGQSVETALADVEAAVAFGPEHLSHYQLTIEPNTAFHADPPSLPGEEAAAEMQERCARALQDAGFRQYEISAWSRPGGECRHNLNYWRYGDYLGIGAGAHGKITLASENEVRRRIRRRGPRDWMRGVEDGAPLSEERALPPAERVFEYFLNQSRLRDGVDASRFTDRTGLDWEAVAGRVETAVSKGLWRREGDRFVPTSLGWRFVNDIQALFLP